MPEDQSNDAKNTASIAASQSLILVVEDEPAIRTIVARKLEDAGWRVMSAPDGATGLRIAQAEQPLLIITDYEMPLLDGISMARSLFAGPATSGIPLILLTARGHRITAADLEATNVVNVMMKPFSMRQLVALATEHSLVALSSKGSLGARNAA